MPSSRASTALTSGLGWTPKPAYLGCQNIAVLVKDNHASRQAVKLAKALISLKGYDTLTLVHAVSSEYTSHLAEQRVLAMFAQDAEDVETMRVKVLMQHPGEGLTELIADAIKNVIKPDLLVIGSQGLCNDTLTEMENASRRPLTGPGSRVGAVVGGNAPLPLGSVVRRKPARLATAMRLAQALHQRVPLLFVKSNTLGAMSLGSGQGLRAMVDVTSTSRHSLEWLLGRLQAARGDSIVLAVGRALDSDAQVRQQAARMLTTFGVQVAVSALGTARQRLLRDASHRALPEAVAADEIDLLLLQSPRCRDLSQPITDLLINARTSVLLWPPDRQANGATVKPPHPLREVLPDDEAREEAPAGALAIADEGVWRARGPRMSFLELGDVPDATGGLAIPVINALRRSASEAARGEGTTQFQRMERALSRSMSVATARTGIDFEALSPDLGKPAHAHTSGVGKEPERSTLSAPSLPTGFASFTANNASTLVAVPEEGDGGTTNRTEAPAATSPPVIASAPGGLRTAASASAAEAATTDSTLTALTSMPSSGGKARIAFGRSLSSTGLPPRAPTLGTRGSGTNIPVKRPVAATARPDTSDVQR